MNDYVWLNDLSIKFLEQDYLLSGQTVDQRVDTICNTAEEILKRKDFAKKFKENFKKGWYSLASPIWSNFGTDRGVGISCFNSFIDDTSESLINTQAEISMQTKLGGGTSAYFGKIRSRGSAIRNNGYTSGSVHFMQAIENTIKIWSQGSCRRGNCAVYQDIEHQDILEFLHIRAEGAPIQDLSFGVCVKNKWLEEMIAGDAYKRMVWAKVLETRMNTGYPYIFFFDNVNNNLVDVYKDKGLIAYSSNLCSEVVPTSNLLETFICCLSSLNVLHFDEWKNTDAHELLVYFLDAVISEFIEKASKIKFMERAVRYAENHRSIGIGWLGYHSYLQSSMIPFESMEAKAKNIQIARNIQTNVLQASMKMAKEYGEPSLLKGYGRRHALLQAIAPTKSSSFIIGQVSESIEPNRSNYYIKDLAKGKFTIKNPYLEKLLDSKNKNSVEVWNFILKNNGSVQDLDFLSVKEKDVFKTFQEISPMEVIIQASQRQKYIDQSQSLNLMIHPGTSPRELNKLILDGWRLDIKTFYYQISINAAQKFANGITSCKSCEA